MTKEQSTNNLPKSSVAFNHNDLDYTEIANLISELIRARNYNQIRLFTKQLPISKLIKSIEIMEPVMQMLFFRFLETSQASEIFAYLDSELQAHLIVNFTEDLAHEVVNFLSSDEVTDMLEELPSNISIRILNKVNSKSKRELINKILKYDEDSVGAIMKTDISLLNKDWTLQKAIAEIKDDYNDNKDLSHYYFVVDDNKKLVGAITLEEIIFNEKNKQLHDFIFNVESVNVNTEVEKAQNIFASENISSLPVTDENDILIGVINSEAMVDSVNEFGTEDLLKQANIINSDNNNLYFKTSIKNIVKNRVFWLIVLLLMATFSQIIIENFQIFIDSNLNSWITTAILSSLAPVLSGSAGNAGSQSSVTISRAASLGELDEYSKKKVFLKELKVSFIIGAILFIVNIIRLLIYFSISKDLINHPSNILLLIFVSSFSLWLIIILSKSLGTFITLLALHYKKDPAALAAPLLTTLIDAISITIFYGLVIGIFLFYDWAIIGSLTKFQ